MIGIGTILEAESQPYSHTIRTEPIAQHITMMEVKVGMELNVKILSEAVKMNIFPISGLQHKSGMI